MMLIGDEPQSYPSYRDIAPPITKGSPNKEPEAPAVPRVRGFFLSNFSQVGAKKKPMDQASPPSSDERARALASAGVLVQ